MLQSIVIGFTWFAVIVFVPIETYLSFWIPPISVSGYVVNVIGVGISLWGVISLRKGKPYAEGLLATGWGWTTAAAWRATNLRYWLASEGTELSFGSRELWVAPVLTLMAAAVFAASLVLLINRHAQAR